MEKIYIPHLSVDCVLFAFEDKQLKVLLVNREKVAGEDETLRSGLLKLPGRLIFENEFLEDAATDIVTGVVGEEPVYLQQFQAFGDPNRIQSPNDLLWLQTQTKLTINRVVTVAFYALVRNTETFAKQIEAHNAQWLSIEEAKGLAFDHDVIVQEAYEHLKKELTASPLEFSLLPEYFTLNSLQNLYEVILEQEFDNRNFRKKVLKMPYLVETDKMEKNVTHRPAKLFCFDNDIYEKNRREMSLFFL